MMLGLAMRTEDEVIDISYIIQRNRDKRATAKRLNEIRGELTEAQFSSLQLGWELRWQEPFEAYCKSIQEKE